MFAKHIIISICIERHYKRIVIRKHCQYWHWSESFIKLVLFQIVNFKKKIISKWPLVTYRKNTTILVLPFAKKQTSRYLQNYAHRKKSKTYHKKNPLCIPLIQALTWVFNSSFMIFFNRDTIQKARMKLCTPWSSISNRHLFPITTIVSFFMH